MGGSGEGGSQATRLALHPALGLLPRWTVVDGGGTGTLGREEPELGLERSRRLWPWASLAKASHALAFCPPGSLVQARPSVIFPHPHGARDRPRLRLCPEACSVALLGPGLSFPRREGHSDGRRQQKP